MLKKELRSGEFHFVEFDSKDAEYVNGKEVAWIRIDGTSLSELPKFSLSDSGHIFIQGSRNVTSIGNNSPFSLVVDSCHNLSSLIRHQVCRLRHLEIRNCKRLTDFSVLSFAKELRSLTVTALPKDASALDQALNQELGAVFLAPVSAKRIHEHSRKFPQTVFCNGPYAFIGGERQTENSIYYERADEIGSFDNVRA